MYHCMSCLGYCNCSLDTVTMNDYIYLSQLIEENEEVAEEKILLQAAAAAMIIYLGVEEYQALQAKRQQPISRQLCSCLHLLDGHV